MKNKILQDILVIGDPHCSASRKEAWRVSTESILNKIKNKHFKKIIITGDLFNKTPSIAERILFAEFLTKLKKYSDGIILIKGTDSHEYSQGNYNYEDITLLTDIKAVEEYKVKDFIFGHYEVKGTKYINGFKSESKRDADKNKTYILGHIHSPILSFKNINYIGSMYKCSFAEINDQKRIAFINEDTIEWIDIYSRPMHIIELKGEAGIVKAKGIKSIEEENIDLKIKAETDTVSLPEIHRTISKLKKKYNVEYYVEEIATKEIKASMSSKLDREKALEDYCKLKKVDIELVRKELK